MQDQNAIHARIGIIIFLCDRAGLTTFELHNSSCMASEAHT